MSFVRIKDASLQLRFYDTPKELFLTPSIKRTTSFHNNRKKSSGLTFLKDADEKRGCLVKTIKGTIKINDKSALVNSDPSDEEESDDDIQIVIQTPKIRRHSTLKNFEQPDFRKQATSVFKIQTVE